MYSCVHVCMYACVHVCMYVYMQVCACVHTSNAQTDDIEFKGFDSSKFFVIWDGLLPSKRNAQNHLAQEFVVLQLISIRFGRA